MIGTQSYIQPEPKGHALIIAANEFSVVLTLARWSVQWL